MSRENVQIVRRAYEAFNQGDLEGILGFVDPEIEVRPDPDLPDWRVFERREGFLSFAGAWLEPWDAYSIEIERSPVPPTA